MVLIKIDRDMMISELYRLRSLIPLEADEAKDYLATIIDMVTHAPLDKGGANYPRIGVRKD